MFSRTRLRFAPLPTLVLLLLAPLLHGESTFTALSGDAFSWNDADLWSPTVPDGVDASAIFLTPEGDQTISNFGANLTLGSLSVTNDSSFPLLFTAAHSLTFAASNNQAEANIAGSGDAITRITNPVVLASDLAMNVSNDGVTDTRGALSFEGGISGSGRITKTGSGKASISAGTYTGGLAIHEGTVRLDGTGIGFGSTPSSYVADQVVIDGGRLEYDASGGSFISGVERGFYLGEDHAEIASTGTRLLIIQGITSGPGHLTKTGAGSLSLNAVNTFTGGTTIAEGTLRLGVARSLGTGPVQLGIAGGGEATLHAALANHNHSNPITVVSGAEGALTIGGVSTASFNTIFSGPIMVDGDLIISSVSPSGNRLSFTGEMSGSGNITKVGPGQWRLFEANTWTGNLTIVEGNVAVDSSRGEMRFKLRDGGITNHIEGPGELIVDGAFSLDIDDVTEAGVWSLYDANSLPVDFGNSFGVRIAGDIAILHPVASGRYQLGGWTFNRESGTVTYDPKPLEPLTPIAVEIDPLNAPPNTPWIVFVPELRIRTEPSARGGAATLAGVLYQGDQVEGDYFIIEETDEEWLRITHEGQNHWIHRAGVTRPHPTNLDNIALHGDLPIGQELVNRWWALPLDYEPSDLSLIPSDYATNASSTMRLRQEARDSIISMIDAARADGVGIWITSPYRSGETQLNLYSSRTSARPSQRGTAPPGHSEHQLGTTADLSGSSTGGLLRNTDEAYLWLLENASRFGWVQTYTADNRDETGYIEEPWHWRFFGSTDLKVITEAIPAEGGTVTGAGSYPPHSVVELEAIPAAGFTFAGWEGDFSGMANPLIFTIENHTTVQARFLNSFEAGRVAGQQEVLADPAAFGLFSPESIQDLRMGGLLLQAGEDGVSLEFSIETSGNLHDWQTFEIIERLFELSVDKHFLRIRATAAP